MSDELPKLFLGRVLPYDCSIDFALYHVRFEQTMGLNGIRDDKLKLRMFLHHCGPELRTLVDALRPSIDAEAQSYAAVSAVLLRHFRQPKEVAQRYAFHNRNQNASESFDDYVRELRALAQSCNFGAFVGNALRDRFVMGIHHERVRVRLLGEPNLCIDKALRIAHSMEAVEPVDIELVATDCNRRRWNEKPAPWTYSETRATTVGGGDGNTDADRARQRASYGDQLMGPSQALEADEAGASSGTFDDIQCYRCNERGHFARSCKSCRTEPTDDASEVRRYCVALSLLVFVFFFCFNPKLIWIEYIVCALYRSRLRGRSAPRTNISWTTWNGIQRSGMLLVGLYLDCISSSF